MAGVPACTGQWCGSGLTAGGRSRVRDRVYGYHSSAPPLPTLLSVLETGPEGWGILSSRAASVGVAAGIQCILHGSQVKYTTTISGALVCRLETPGLTSIDGYTATARLEAGNLLVG